LVFKFQKLRGISDTPFTGCHNPEDIDTKYVIIHGGINYVYDFDTKLYRQQATVILHHENIHVNFRNIDEGETQHRNYKRLKLGDDQAYSRSNV
jgi:hypothetical protein